MENKLLMMVAIAVALGVGVIAILYPASSGDQGETAATPIARRKRRVKFAGGGSLVQLLGLFVGMMGLFFWPLLIPLGITALILFIIGSSMSQYYSCSDCGNRIDGRHVKICPTCRASFS